MKLMLAEDEPGLSRALTAILQHSDYEVDTALGIGPAVDADVETGKG